MRVNHLFAGLMIFQWAAAIVAAVVISPRAWDGDVSQVHLYVWAALLLGGLIVSLPVALALLRPEAVSTRHVIAVGQMLMGGLLIHLSGGRIETHFHVFGSLAFLALYRDWRVLITASAVAGLDHLLRGIFWPQSIYGVLTASVWRWFEHVGWVVFEDVVLIGSCLQGVREMREVADRQAQLEAIREGIESTVRERTEALRETTERMREGEARMRAILGAAADGIVTFDDRRVVESLNEAAETIFGLDPGEMVGCEITTLIPDLIDDASSPHPNAGSVGRVGREVEGRRRDGSRFAMEMAVSEALVGSQRLSVAIVRDIADRKRAEEALEAAKGEAERSSRVKSEFLANMSHEIRTPMNGILGMTELALEITPDARQKEYLGLVKSSAEALLTIIDDILDFSKIEAGKLDLDPVPFRLRELLDDMLEVLVLRARARSLELHCRVAPDVPDALIGDPGRIRQVILNLVGNAIKFTSSGEIVVSVQVQPEGAGPGSLRFSVADTGIGIPIEKRRAIFEPFQQADGSTTRKYGGTGLGLSISARLVAMMGGRIWVEGEFGQGSVFLFDAELGLNEEAAQSDHRGDAGAIAGPDAPTVDGNPAGLDVRPLRILVADDNDVNQKVAAGMLKRMGHSTVVVGDGRAALQAWREGRFDLILMDVQMPEMDGFEALAAIRALEGPSGDRVPIVALTAHAMSGDRERCLNAGFDEYLSKPIRSDRLREVIEGQTASAAARRRPTVEPALPTVEEFDEAAALESFGGDMEFLIEIMHLFFDDCPRLLAELDGAVNQSDASALRRLGHTIRGVAGNFSMTAVVDAAARLETMGKLEELGTARTTLTELRDAIDRVRPALDLLEQVGCSAR
jgi:two-component system, sensor histidine kinase and response regulator